MNAYTYTTSPAALPFVRDGRYVWCEACTLSQALPVLQQKAAKEGKRIVSLWKSPRALTYRWDAEVR